MSLNPRKTHPVGAILLATFFGSCSSVTKTPEAHVLQVQQQTEKTKVQQQTAKVDCTDGYGFHPVCQRAGLDGVLLSNGRCVDCKSDAYHESYPLARYWLAAHRFTDPPPPEARRRADGSYEDKYGHPWELPAADGR